MSNIPEVIDLTNCDREPIHLPGQIQPHGVLLTLQEPELIVLQASQNTASWLGIEAEQLLGQTLDVLFDPAQIADLKTRLANHHLSLFNPVEIRVRSPATDPRSTHYQLFDAILHRSQGILILELEPHQLIANRSTSGGFLGFYPLLQQAICGLREAKDITHLTQVIVQEIRRLTGFDRVMVYRFETDHSGVVIAEEKQANLEAYLGLHYPASDIPVQARQLYYENWLRLIPDVHYQPANLIPIHHPITQQPLDLSPAVLRSVSPLHVEYLQNMGVAASMSISLITEKRLWGLISCHHHTPKYVDYETRKACEFLGQIASVELVHQQDRTARRYREQVRSIQEQFRQSFTYEPDFIEHVLQQNQARLLDLVQAQGAAIVLGAQLTLVGQTPAEAEVQMLINELLDQTRQDVFCTDSLSQLDPTAKAFKDRASGMLAISIFLNQKTYHILWFRPEQIQVVHWAGDPRKPVSVTADGEMRLSPRRSFELWKETVEEKSLPWQPLEQEAAQEMRNILMLAALEFSQAAMEQAAERATIANRAKSQFLAKMSHELRTPLNAILGFTQIMSRDRSLLPEYQEHLGIISRSGEHLLALINDVLEMSKIEAGQPTLNNTYFDLHRLAYSIQDLFLLKAADKQLQLNVEQYPDLPQYVYGDEGKLRQILINLVANAIKFTATGHVTLRVKPESELAGSTLGNADLASGLVKSPPADPQTSDIPFFAQFEVEDTGFGIPLQEQESIFEAFMQTDQGRHLQGTGLGLSISRQFARLMGGDVTVESQLGQGSIFRCYVQLARATNLDFISIAVAQRVIGLAPGQPDYRILIVEDIPENQQLLMKLLEMVGFTVRAAANGLEAIACWEEWQPHLILMDIQMPDMDGYEATRQIRDKERRRMQSVPIQSVPI
nr:ATP-binding protein [Elainella sp. Prado103]